MDLRVHTGQQHSYLPLAKWGRGVCVCGVVGKVSGSVFQNVLSEVIIHKFDREKEDLGKGTIMPFFLQFFLKGRIPLKRRSELKRNKCLQKVKSLPRA